MTITRLAAAAAIVAMACFQGMAAAQPKDLPVICRDAWGAATPRSGLKANKIEVITVHHSGTIFKDDKAAPRTIRRFQTWHQGRMKYPDIAYHFLIDRQGNIYEGRSPEFQVDTPTDYNPAGHLSICLIGNFEVQTPGTKQLEALADLLAWAMNRYSVPSDKIKGHRDYAHTLCPGKSLYEQLKSGNLVRMATASGAAGAPSMHVVCGADASAMVDRIEGRASSHQR